MDQRGPPLPPSTSSFGSFGAPGTPVTGTLQYPPGMQQLPPVPSSYAAMGPPTVTWPQASLVPSTASSSSAGNPSPAQVSGNPGHSWYGPSPSQSFGHPGQPSSGPSPAQFAGTPAQSQPVSHYGTPAYQGEPPPSPAEWGKCCSLSFVPFFVACCSYLFLRFLGSQEY
jgi:hypothetical protein